MPHANPVDPQTTQRHYQEIARNTQVGGVYMIRLNSQSQAFPGIPVLADGDTPDNDLVHIKAVDSDGPDFFVTPIEDIVELERRQ